MPSNCCVPQCKSYYKRDKTLKYHQIPSDKSIRRKWLVAIKSQKKPSKYTKVCSKHFLDSDYTVTSLGEWKILKSGAVPSQNLPQRTLDKKTKFSERSQRLLRRQSNQIDKNLNLTDKSLVSPNYLSANDNLVQDDTDNSIVASYSVVEYKENGYCDHNSIQRENLPSTSAAVTNSIAVQTTITLTRSQLISFSFLSDVQLKHFSGFEKHEFLLLCDFFKTTNHYVRALTLEDEILVTLMKYRHDFYYTTLGVMFDVNYTVIRRIINFWTNHLYKKLKCIDFWGIKCKRSKSEYDVIIDCTECPIETSQDPVIQQATFSSYKNTNTFKVLVGCTEYGAVVYVSEVYGGAISDRLLIQKCGFIDNLEEGQFILADRGFDISDLLETKGVHLNIPPFKVKKQLTEEDICKTRAIANRRIIIEQLNGLAKKNLILVHKMPSHIWPLANQIIFNCFMLTNFRNSIVKNSNALK